MTKEELDQVALESTRTIDIDEFVEKSEIDPRYLIRPYYLSSLRCFRLGPIRTAGAGVLNYEELATSSQRQRVLASRGLTDVRLMSRPDATRIDN